MTVVQILKRNIKSHLKSMYFFTVNYIHSITIFMYLYSNSVLAKYAGHVRQTSADVRQGAQTLPDILSGRVQYTENVQQMSDIIKHTVIFAGQ